MGGTVEEQGLSTKNVNAKKVNTAKTQADRSCKNLLTQFSHVLHLHAPVVYYCFGHYFLTKKLNKNRLSISKYGLIVAVDHFLIFFVLKKLQ
jgi:hypothetical protein